MLPSWRSSPVRALLGQRLIAYLTPSTRFKCSDSITAVWLTGISSCQHFGQSLCTCIPTAIANAQLRNVRPRITRNWPPMMRRHFARLHTSESTAGATQFYRPYTRAATRGHAFCGHNLRAFVHGLPLLAGPICAHGRYYLCKALQVAASIGSECATSFDKPSLLALVHGPQPLAGAVAVAVAVALHGDRTMNGILILTDPRFKGMAPHGCGAPACCQPCLGNLHVY